MRTRSRQFEGDESPLHANPGLLRLYEACIENAEALVDDARLLAQNGRFARAFALAFTVYEEVGKSQIVANAYYGLVAVSELTGAFRRHDLKVAYVDRVVRLEPASASGQDATIEYEPIEAQALFQARMRSLYVDFGMDYAPAMPGDAISQGQAEYMIEVVVRELEAIAWAETLNGRIGTKGLFK